MGVRREAGGEVAHPGAEFARAVDHERAVQGGRSVPSFAPGSARPADNHVEDVDRVHKELGDFVTDVVNGPATMPWGNRSLLFRDPDGNLVNFLSR